ncbi:MAG TPA: ABC transporter substrate-binding protein, partial [Acidimicrobiales bacterium]|nr:ABC transporter substrate-binding protein [Acidimicrobiales bacterium]
MRHPYRLLSLPIVLVTTALIATGWASPSSAAPAKKFTPGLIAVDAPLTGSQSSTGIDMWRGAQLAATQINASGGVDGVMIKLVKADDKATA